MKALIDGDTVVYRVGFACQKEHYIVYCQEWGEMAPPCAKFIGKTALNEWLATKAGPVYNLYEAGDSIPYFRSHEEGTVLEYIIFKHIVAEELSHVLHNVKQSIRRIVSDTGAGTYTCFLTGKGNFRERIATIQKYKGNRDPNSKPVWYEEIKRYLIERHGAVVADGAEADDQMAIEQTRAGNGDTTVICTTDKDLLQVSGYNYNPTTRKMIFISEREARLNFWEQMLVGDATDNIPGLYKLTGKIASKTLKDGLATCHTEGEMWLYVRGIYAREHGLCSWEDLDKVLTEIGRLLYMQRYEKQLWEPPIEDNEHEQDY